MEALCVQPWEKAGLIMEGEQVQKSRGLDETGPEALVPAGAATDEDTDEESEPEPEPVPRRKVSFADAFGLNLVSVKEFDKAEASESYENPPQGSEVSLSLEEFSMSRLFTIPSSPEELDQRLREQMVELESIELLPGTTSIRGNIRVVNLCYAKSVQVRMSLDRWATHFDLLADYVPGSSDRRTDRFTFTYTLVPPLETEGTRVELCLCYETPLGTFWANNKGINYVLFCCKKVPVNGSQVQEEGKSKRSCLRASRRPSAEGKPSEPSDTPTGSAEAAQKAEKDREAAVKAELRSLSYQKSLVDGVKSRRRGTRLARVTEFMSQQRLRFSTARSQDVDGPLWADPGGLNKGQRSPRVLTYHEIPLLTLDWNSAQTCTWGGARAGDRSKSSGEAPRDRRGTAPDTRGDSDSQASVGDVWQAFLNGSSCGGHAGLLESEWLQTATSVSPSDHPKAPSSRGGEPDVRSFQLPRVASKRQPEAARVSSPGGDGSEPPTGPWQEFGVMGAKQASKGPADRSAESHTFTQEQERGGRIEGTAEESPTPLTADLEARSGEAPEPETVGLNDRISRKDKSLTLTLRPVESSRDETCPVGAVSFKERHVLAGPATSEGSEKAASDDGEPLQDAGAQTSDGSSQETERQMGQGLGGIQRDGGHKKVPEPGQKEEEEEAKSNGMSPKEIDPLRQPETSVRTEEDTNLRASVELRGHAGVAQGEQENSPTLEGGELPAGAVAALHVMQSQLTKATIGKFGEDLVRAVWEEVFKIPKNDSGVDGPADSLDASPVPLQELPPRLQDPLPQESSQALLFSAAQTSADSSQRSTTEEESRPQIRDEQEVARQDGCDPAGSQEPSSPAWWSVFYLLSHITRLPVFSGFVVGLFFYFVLCDFPAFFAVYLFSVCCWFYKWKRRQVAKAEGMVGWFMCPHRRNALNQDFVLR